MQYIIVSKSKTNGRRVEGTKRFTKADAEALAAELNEDYPSVEHSVKEVSCS